MNGVQIETKALPFEKVEGRAGFQQDKRIVGAGTVFRAVTEFKN